MGLLDELTAKFKRKCEAISTEKRHQLGLQSFDALPADCLATHLSVFIVPIESFKQLSKQSYAVLTTGNNWSAAVISCDPIQIVHNPNHTGDRRESDLMHELGHIILKHPMAQFDARKQPLRQKQYENEATYLGSCLQIPRRGLLWATQSGMTLTQIAEHFNASEEMVLFRSNAFGLRRSVEKT